MILTRNDVPLNVVVDRINYVLEECSNVIQKTSLSPIATTYKFSEEGELTEIVQRQSEDENILSQAEQKYNELIELKNLIISHIEGMF